MTGEKSGLPTLFQKSRKHTALTGELILFINTQALHRARETQQKCIEPLRRSFKLDPTPEEIELGKMSSE
ncbi:hypothetical protein DTO212C5_2637 [Paecilomyces variotii]|nr:hypothetical protein DTO212C5_2637 [Paecilomyces variotii]KAJ9308535.1 hypothetical protein DTO217A2_2028 [Paecilomyces variotii]